VRNLDLIWQESFNKAIGDEQTKSGTNPVNWRAGGRISKEWPSKENGDWWIVNGLEMFNKFNEVWAGLGWNVWHAPGGNIALELEVNQNYGDTFVKAFIDMVAVNSDGELIVVDYKTSKSMPSSMQLGLYACSLEKAFGIRPAYGAYYDARKGQMVTQMLDRWTIPLFEYLFRQFETAISNEIFLPNVSRDCGTCSVGDYCYTNGGQMADMFDPLYAIANKKGK
jgi:hypothetical protein